MMAVMGACDICGSPTRKRVNGFWFCDEHDEPLFAKAARLDAYVAGAPSDVIVWAGDVAVEFARHARLLRDAS